MPVYVYKCDSCDEEVDIITTIQNNASEIACECGSMMSKLICNTSFVLKGSGWGKDGYS